MMTLDLSVEAVIDIAKTVPTLVLELPDGQKLIRTIFNIRDQQLIRHLFLKFLIWVFHCRSQEM